MRRPYESRQAGAIASEEKPPLDAENYVFDEITELTDRWVKRLTLDNLSIAERYLNSNLNIIVNCRADLGNGACENVRAIFRGGSEISWIQPYPRQLDFLFFGGVWHEVDDSKGPI